MIFKLIMGGMHPFSSVVEPDDQTAIAQLGEKIKQQLFPYNEDSTVPDRYKVAAPEYKVAWDNARDESRPCSGRPSIPSISRTTPGQTARGGAKYSSENWN